MDTHNVSSRGLICKVSAWVLWSIFLLCSISESILAVVLRNDPYFIRHYRLYPMNGLTILMSAHPIWMTLLPFLWLPFMILYQRHPTGKPLLVLGATMFVCSVVVVVMLFCSGPPIQM